jgi:hypothetical protein
MKSLQKGSDDAIGCQMTGKNTAAEISSQHPAASIKHHPATNILILGINKS